MPRDIARDALYNGRINLWVEDDLMRAYLGAIWNDPAVKFLVGGGSEGVEAILKDAENGAYSNVFGVVDRDHGRTNFSDWLVPGRAFRKFVLPRHEIENYLLDTPALQGCRFNTNSRSIAQIDAFLYVEAGRRCWWAACRDVVALIRDRFFDQFLSHPKMPPVGNEIDAMDHIRHSVWFRNLPRKSSLTTEARIHRLLLRMHSRAQRLLEDGGWRSEFSGKEIFRDIGSKIFDRTKARYYRPSQAVFDTDLAKSVAAWQIANNAIPTELIDLQNALKARIAPAT